MSFHSWLANPYYPVVRRDPFDVFEPRHGRLSDSTFAGALLGDDFLRALGPHQHQHVMGGMQLTDTEVKVAIDTKHFKPEELDVKIVGDEVVIHGKHEEKDDEHGSISREFTRKYTLPEDVDPTTVTSSLSHSGVLSICAPRKGPQAIAKSIPITIEQKPAVEGDAAKK